MNDVKLENILMKFAIRVLETQSGKENPTIGELIDTPRDEILALFGVDDETEENEDVFGTEEQYEKAEQLRDSMREDGISV